MIDRLKRLAARRWPHALVPLALLAVCVLAYGLLARRLGFFWDDWAFIWIRQQLGAEGLARYFSTNRPYWGLLVNFTESLLGANPLTWQIFGLFWRWAAALALWALLRRVWPAQPEAAAWASLLFAVYPGFGLQPVAVNFGHFFLVFTCLLTSFYISLKAQSARTLPARVGLTLAALLLSLVNLLTMEYFFLLELLRPLFLFAAADAPAPKARLRRALTAALPYLALFVGVGVWRAFFFPYQNQNYDFSLLARFQADGWGTLWMLITTALTDMANTGLAAWGRAFLPPDPAVLGSRTTLAYAALIALTLAGVGIFLALLRSESTLRARTRAPWALPAIGLGLIGLLIAGGPFWLTGLIIHFDFPNSRFTIPFMLGSVLLLTGLVGLLPVPRWGRIAVVAALVAFGVGQQFENANAFRRDWDLQRSLFWQMAWRAPDIQPGTTLISGDLPIQFSSDNSLTAPLNWIYAPDNRSAQMDYMFYLLSVRLDRGLQSLAPDTPIRQNYLAARFDGNTSQAVVLSFVPPACLRVLDPELDAVNAMLNPDMREAAPVSNAGWIVPGEMPTLPATIFGSEPAHRWCYYYEKAELARQIGDWAGVAELGDRAFASGDYPNDPMERVVFIEGYAHAGQWTRAVQLNAEAAGITPMMQPVLCTLWQRIERQTDDSPGRQDALSSVQQTLNCSAP